MEQGGMEQEEKVRVFYANDCMWQRKEGVMMIPHSGWMKAINRKGQNRKRTSGGGKIFEHVEFHMIKGIHVVMQNYNSESHCPHTAWTKPPSHWTWE